MKCDLLGAAYLFFPYKEYLSYLAYVWIIWINIFSQYQMFRKHFINVRLHLDLECFTASSHRIMSHCTIQTAILLLETGPHFLNYLVERNPE